MLLEIPGVLTRDEVLHMRERLVRYPFLDGARTAGHQAVDVKRNLELAPGPEWRALSEEIYAALMRHPLFVQFVLPKRLMRPLFNRYDVGMEYGSHTDVSLMDLSDTHQATRTDLSLTVFLSDPETYDGGELVIAAASEETRCKPPAGTAVIYPSGNLHWVEKVTRGSRLAAVGWAQSFVRCPERRCILFELDGATELARAQPARNDQADILLSIYHKLLRLWAEP